MPVFGPGTTSLGLRSFSNFYKHGRKIFKKFIQKGETTAKANPKNCENVRFEAENLRVDKICQVRATPKAYDSPLARFVSRYASGTFAAQLRRKAALQFQDLSNSTSATLLGRLWWNVGRRAPLYALVGFGLTAGTATDADETGFHNVCNHIKELFAENAPQSTSGEVLDIQEGHLDRYTFGKMIAKGCNSAVYKARTSEIDNEEYECLGTVEEMVMREDEEDATSEVDESDTESEFSIISEEEDYDMLPELDDTADYRTGSDITVLPEETDYLITSDVSEHELTSLQDTDLSLDVNYDLAVKMMFNYEAESTACAIVYSMENELVPARVDTQPVLNQWMNGHHVKKKRLPPHPNIVDITDVFVDEVPSLEDAYREYPDALPERLNPDGFGRNSTLFLVMQRYECTLQEYLHQYTPTIDEGLCLLSQLLEALVHLQKHEVAHRDLKSDNILLREVGGCCHLVLSDFGCCLAEEAYGLRLPYTTEHVAKGGNTCLMAPEILSAKAGPGVNLDYSKADLWAAGAIAYEIFGAQNPFYRGADGKRLNALTYTDEDLPDLPSHIPPVIQRIVKAMLTRDNKKRPEVEVVANCIQLLQLAPAEWNLPIDAEASSSQGPIPGKCDVMRWILTLSATCLLEKSFPAPPLVVRHELTCQFLARMEFSTVMQSLEFMWKVV